MARLPPPQAGRFCRPGTNFIEHDECRDISLLSGRVLVPVLDVVNALWRACPDGAKRNRESRYKHYGFVLGAEADAKTVTNNLPLALMKKA